MSRTTARISRTNGLLSAARKFLKAVARGFCLLFLITLYHRFVALAIYAEGIGFKATYYGYTDFQAALIYFEQFKPAIANGLRADVLFSLAAAFLMAVFPRRFWIIGAICLAAFYAGNLEHIKYNLTSVDFALIGLGADATFIAAQFTPALVAHFAVGIVIGMAVLVLLRLSASQVFAFWITLVTVCVAAVPIYPANLNQPRWMQTHPLLPSLRSPSLPTNPHSFPETAFQERLLSELGEIGTTKNVLIVYLEGVSTFSVERGEMSFLRELSENNIHFTQYLSHQIITANGLYSSLTGGIPRFINPALRWHELTADDPRARAALPNLLQAEGYQTGFVQSAPLYYMEKDHFLPLLGFETLIGDANFDSWHSKGGWGVDDLTLFENVISHIDQLDTEKPWMVATLTTGTHAPYNVPEGFRSDMPSLRNRALNYADDALRYLVTALESRGLLENTIVVITADESREMSGGTYLQDEIALNWLPLVIINKDQPPATIDGYFTTADLPRLVASQLNGTAIIDLEPKNDQIAMGNIVSGRFLYLDTQAAELLTCDTSSFACAMFGNIRNLRDAGDAVSLEAAVFPGLRALVEAHE